MEKTIIHPADTRGHANLGWLDSHHTFSFANYYNPERVHFGVLRVLNDDVVEGGKGFGTHPHENMEIISIPIYGAMEHKDSMGNTGVIGEGDVQIMSAGTGVFHSEYNRNPDAEVNFLQIWIFPREKNIAPRYAQKNFPASSRKNALQTVISGRKEDTDALWINQEARLSLGSLEKGFSTEYTFCREKNGVYVFVIDGSVTVNGTTIGKRDAIGITDADAVKITAEGTAEILVIDVPMAIPKV